MTFCHHCKGTGGDEQKTKKAAALGFARFVRCSYCEDGGVEPNYSPKAKLVREILPTFCFVTSRELLEMASIANEEITESDIAVALQKLKKNGVLVKRKAHNSKKWEYRRHELQATDRTGKRR